MRTRPAFTSADAIAHPSPEPPGAGGGQGNCLSRHGISHRSHKRHASRRERLSDADGHCESQCALTFARVGLLADHEAHFAVVERGQKMWQSEPKGVQKDSI